MSMAVDKLVLAEVWVPGHPKTKGSLESLGQGRMRESVKGSKAWRRLVARTLGPYPAGEPYRGRFGVQLVSFLQPPAGLSVEKAREWILGDKSGDADKLLRNVLDAAGCEDKDDAHLIYNDAMCWDAMTHKRLALAGQLPGQQIRFWAVLEGEPW